MAVYTMELRTIIEHGYNIFNFPYEFYDEKEREKFQRDFIRHFYFREIGTETIDRFLLNLEDIFATVFPYYNELFKTAEIEYSILDNYKLMETTTIKRDNVGKSSGVSSSVGQVFDTQETESNESRQGESSGTTTATENGESNTTINGTDNKTENQNVIKKFLDTPQGLTDLTDTRYLTTLNQDTSETTSTGKTTSTTTGTDEKSSESETHQTDTTETTATAKTSAEQKTTADSNTRNSVEQSMSETLETLRSGNIGVDTDADMIQKHIKLQQILKKIELMFFDECECLFMGVY